ncbi:MAG TPA: DUF533 domain-containing protein [Labilithrix sp.]|jgi:uncharacterized tellurite resistance protein B-like protein
MAIPQDEASACLEILVAMMKADGRVDPAEKKSLAAALEAFEVQGTSIEKLLDAPVDVDAALARITSTEGRDQAFRSAVFMAHADGQCGKAEEELLAKIEAALDPPPGSKARLSQTFAAKPQGKAAALVEAVSGLFKKRG